MSALTALRIRALSRAVHGPVLRPGQDGYAREVAGFNLATTHTPDIIVGATRAADVVAAVSWAAASATPVAVQATGHGANLAVDHGLLISTARMTGVEIDPNTRTATVGAGARWRHVLDAAAPHGLAALNGSSSDVGVVGYTVGGGLPVLGRAFGYAAEWVRSFQVVTAEGTLREVDATHEPELFWALRGGKGNVGIVTSLVCELLPLRRIYGGGLYYPGEHAADLLRAYAAWVRTLPDNLCTAFTLLRLPPFPDVPEPLRGRFVARVAVAYPGDPSRGARLIAPMRAAAPLLIDTVTEMDYLDVDRIYQDPEHPLPVREGCTLLRDLTPAVVETLLDEAGPDAPCPLLMVEIRHLSGRLSQAPTVEDAICARDASFLVETVGILAGPHAQAVPAATAGLHAALAPYSTGRTMVNLHGTPGDDTDRARAWTPEVHTRLRRVKAGYDPANLIRFGHAVTPAMA
jgi:FAD/FMN-containing dehydrogenase